MWLSVGHAVVREILLELNAAIRARLGGHFFHFERVREFGVQLRRIRCRVGYDAVWDTMPRGIPHSEMPHWVGHRSVPDAMPCGT